MNKAWVLLVLGGMMVGISGFANADTLPAGATPVSGVVRNGPSCIEGLPLQDWTFVLTDLILEDAEASHMMREGSPTGPERLIISPRTDEVHLQTGLVFREKPCMGSQSRFTYSGYILPNPS